MAKIRNIELHSVPKEILANNDSTDITVKLEIKFHLIDIQLQMQYQLHLYVFNIHGEMDIPVVYPNWDESDIVLNAKELKDDYIGHFVYPVRARTSVLRVEKHLDLHLGKNTTSKAFLSKRTKVFVSLIPATAYATMWSKEYKSDILFN